MKLYHVSTKNTGKRILDLSKEPKYDNYFTGDLIYKVSTFESFHLEYSSSKISELGNARGWSVEKIAAEAIFEYIRQKKCFHKPSRLSSAFFTNSLENAEKFNAGERGGKGDVFVFDAYKNNAFYFDMDLFHHAYTTFKSNQVTEENFKLVKRLAEVYWDGYENINNANCEILYLGLPVLKNLKWE